MEKDFGFKALILAALLLVTACATGDRNPVLTATATCRAYAATLSSLAAFRAEMSDATADRVNEIRAWATPICTGEPPTDDITLTQLEDYLYELLLAEQEANNG